MSRLVLVACIVALGSVCDPLAVRAQSPPDSTLARAHRRWTAQEISDACDHKPGARMRLYGCLPEVFIPRRGEPLYILDGRALPADTTGPRRTERDALLRALEWSAVQELTVIPRDSAVARFGSAARHGAVIIRTKPIPPRRAD